MSEIDTEEKQVINLVLNDDVSLYIQEIAEERGMQKEDIIAMFFREIESLSLDELQAILEKELSQEQKNLNDTGEF